MNALTDNELPQRQTQATSADRIGKSTGRPTVLIIGGGFGGLFCARRLGRVDVDVTLLDRAGCHVFQPLLYQCATGTLSIGQISRSLREELAHHHNVKTMLGEAIRLDAAARRVTARRPDESTFDLEYDYLVIAAGMRQSYFGNEQFAAWAPGMKTLDDALSIRRRVFAAFEIAETLPPGPGRDQWLTFAVTGAGPTGVELAGQIRELATRSLANEFHSIEPQDARVLLFDGGDRVLKTFAPALAERATRTLEELGVELHFGVHVTDVRRDGVTVSSKSGGSSKVYATRTVLWTAGVEAVPFARHAAEMPGAKTDRSGRISVNADLSVPDHPEVFVIGDLAGRDGLPGVAENAMQGGLHVAACIRRDLGTGRRKDFRYRDLGSAAYISRGHAVLQAGPVKLTGLLGWLGWGFIHIAFLTGVRNRFSTVGTWMATIARANRSDRSFILGGSGHPEEPYTWESPVHQGHHSSRDDSRTDQTALRIRRSSIMTPLTQRTYDRPRSTRTPLQRLPWIDTGQSGAEAQRSGDVHQQLDNVQSGKIRRYRPCETPQTASRDRLSRNSVVEPRFEWFDWDRTSDLGRVSVHGADDLRQSRRLQTPQLATTR